MPWEPIGLLLAAAEAPPPPPSIWPFIGPLVWLLVALLIGVWTLVLLALAMKVYLRSRRRDGSSSARPHLHAAPRLPYRRAHGLLTRGELAFFLVLMQVVGSRCWVFAKVRLADLLYLPPNTPRWRVWHWKMNQKHVDFVLCDKQTAAPVLVIELDDQSHDRADRRQRDEFVNAALGSAGIPIEHVPCQQAYDVQGLAEQIGKYLGDRPAT